jgi:predicted enzyme related to lactoylglutathione lyase
MGLGAKYVHTNLTARDWRRLAVFYVSVFGCVPRPPERDFKAAWLDKLTGLKGAHLRGIHLGLPGYGEGGPALEIFSYEELKETDRPAANQPGFGHIAFVVDDVSAALEAVHRAGGGAVGERISTEVEGVGRLEVVYARDPEGNIVELQRWHRSPVQG